MYFFFAPTIIYRDQYVRRSEIRWNIVFKNLSTFVFLIFYVWCVFKGLCMPLFRNTNGTPNSVRHFFGSVLFSSVSGMICMLSLFYGILHSWMNLFGELLRFGDRLFYEDWWNAEDFGVYYRKWNIIVHEFLYYYIYQDTIRFSRGMISRIKARYFVFFISAMVHEIIVTATIGFFFPILLIMFGGPGAILVNVKLGRSAYSGAIFWSGMLVGCGLLMVLLCREWYSRQLEEAATFERDGFWKCIYPQQFLLNAMTIE